jgi:solute carrier family 25 iron transporter 28/37
MDFMHGTSISTVSTPAKVSDSVLLVIPQSQEHSKGHGLSRNDIGDDADMYESLPEGTPYWVSAVAGGLAGISEHILMYPFDSIKTRMQMIHTHPHANYQGIFHAMSKISLHEGSKRLFRGISSVIIGAGPAHAMHFCTYETAKKFLIPNGQEGLYPISSALSGACAVVASDAMMNPFDVMKQRMQAYGSSYKHLLDCALTIWRREGIVAFYLSYPTTLLLNIPFQAIQFPTYEFCRHILNPRSDDQSSIIYSPITHIVSGGIAGAIASACTTPLDVIKTLLQTRGISTNSDIRSLNTISDAARVIYQSCGWRGFFRGIGPRVLTFIPSTAACWATYEYFKHSIIGSSQ